MEELRSREAEAGPSSSSPSSANQSSTVNQERGEQFESSTDIQESKEAELVKKLHELCSVLTEDARARGSREAEAGPSSSASSSANQSSTVNQERREQFVSSTGIPESKEELVKKLHELGSVLIEDVRARTTIPDQRPSTIAFISSVTSSVIPLISFFLTTERKPTFEVVNEFSKLFERMNLEIIKGTTYNPSSGTDTDLLKRKTLESLNEIEKIMAKEFNNNEKEADRPSIRLYIVVLGVLPSILVMMNLGNFFGMGHRSAFQSRLALDNYMEEMEKRLNGLFPLETAQNVEEYVKDHCVCFKKLFVSSMVYAFDRDSTYYENLMRYFEEEDAKDPYEKFIEEDEANATKRSKLRKLSLSKLTERKIAMKGIKRRLEVLGGMVEDESRNVDMMRFYDKVISSSLQILCDIIKIFSISQDMENDISKQIKKLDECLATEIKRIGINSASTSSCSSSSGPGSNKKLKEILKNRIQKNIKTMERKVSNGVANDQSIEEEKRLKLLRLIAKKILPSIKRIMAHAQSYNGSDYPCEVKNILCDKEEELKAEFETTIMIPREVFALPKSLQLVEKFCMVTLYDKS